MSRSALFSFGDRFTDPGKDWVVVASESVVRALVLRQHLRVHNVLCLRSGFPEDLAKESFASVGEYVRATADGKARLVATRIFGATSAEDVASVRADLRNPFGSVPEDFDLAKIKFVIGADTVSYCGGVVFEKPADLADAKRQFLAYQENDPEMVTGVSAYARDHGFVEPVFSFYEPLRVKFQRLSEADIDAFLESEDYVGAAGSFKIGGLAESVIERLEGCYTTCVGLPAQKVSVHLCAYLNLSES